MRIVMGFIGLIGLAVAIIGFIDGLTISPQNIMQQNYAQMKLVSAVCGLMLFVLTEICAALLPPPPPQTRRFTLFDKQN